MPTYEYVCDACKEGFEVFQTMSADPVQECPSCKALKVRRVISGGAGIVFKGSGFYETDYKRGDNYQKDASKDKPKKNSSEKSSSDGAKS